MGDCPGLLDSCVFGTSDTYRSDNYTLNEAYSLRSGTRPDDFDDVLHLEDIAFKGGRGLLRFPADWLLRLRNYPFYDYLEQRALDWVEACER